jgi:hypothetical protein
VPNGVHVDRWRPRGDGRDYGVGPTLEPLAGLRDHFQVISGLAHRNGTAGPDGAGDHARATATILTGMRPRKTSGADIRAGISVDQVAAQRIGHATRFPSLELSCDDDRKSGSCDSGYACAYSYNMSWRSETQPAIPEANPRLVFERLFGAGSSEERARSLAARRAARRSILDFVTDEARSLGRRLGGSDRRKLDEYLAGVREIETQIARFDRYYTEQFAYLLERLASAREADGSCVLDHSMVVYASGLSDGNSHRHDDLPVILAGGAGGRLAAGRHLRLNGERPMSDLFVTMLDLVGAPVERFGDSSGRLDEILA